MPLNAEKIVENIQRICKEKGTTPTVACKESGAGSHLVTNLKNNGTMPSIEKFSLLARHLGVTTSELLGEDLTELPNDEIRLLQAYRSADESIKSAVRRVLGID